MPGLLISFDGIDSSGKETQARLLMHKVQTAGHNVGFFQTPDYNSASGIKLKRLFQGQDGSWDSLAWQEKMQLIAANRAEHKAEVIGLLQQGGVVIYDRYVPSSIAHMTADALIAAAPDSDRASIREQVEDHEYRQNQMPHEDLFIFLDLSPAQAAALLQVRKTQLDEPDETTDKIDLQSRIYQEYQFLAREFPHRCIKINCVANNRLLDIQTISDNVWQLITQRFPQLTNPQEAP